MNALTLANIREYLLSKKGTTEEIPFGPDVLVFKVLGKMFALVAHTESPLRVNLKCDPDLAVVLRSEYEAVIPGYHQNKQHWNTIIFGGDVPDETLLGMIDMSYDLVADKLTKAQKKLLAEL